LAQTKFSVEEKAKFGTVLVTELMSSEEETVDENNKRVFKLKKLDWRKKRYQKLLDIVDKEYTNSASKRAKEQMVMRIPGSPSKRPRPTNLGENFNEFI